MGMRLGSSGSDKGEDMDE